MNPSANQQPDTNLTGQTPASRTVMSPSFEAPNRVGEPSSLMMAANLANNIQNGAPVPALTLPAVPNNQQPINIAVTNTTVPVAPLTADDGDLIEKEWVNKAKSIVKNYSNDPHRQSKELTLFKAEYMQKRYNKTIKLGE